jgi:hypothetical protein
MKIKDIRKSRLTNAWHLQFMLEIIVLINKFGVILSRITSLFDVFRVGVDKEELCHKFIRKSEISDLKAESDKARDTLVLGIKDALKSALRHFDANVREAAHRLKIVFDAYDRPTPIVDLQYDAETLAINNMLQEFEGKYASDVQIAGLTEWVKELRVRNDAFDLLAKSYNEQLSEKPPFQTQEVRKETDEAYDEIVSAVNGLIVLEKEKAAEYAQFVSEMNTIIKHYNDLLAQHLGRIEAKKEKEKEKGKGKEKTAEPAKQAITGQVAQNTSEQANTNTGGQVNVNANTSGKENVNVNKDTKE